MIYVVSNNENITNNTKFKTVTVEQSIAMISCKKKWQFDTETTGIDPHLDKLLCMQFGNDELDARFVIDCVSVDPKLYKQLLESRFLIMQNGKFDLQFLYSQGIVCRNVYDTMIVEQFLYLGYPFKSENFTFGIGYSLKDIAERRLGIELDKTVRGQIKWRGLDDTVIEYAAYDVVYLEKIAKDQMIDVKKQNGTLGAKIECEFTPVIAYLEWCGIKLDEDKWKAKMVKDNIKLAEALEKLNKYCINHPNLKKWVTVNLQGDLFDGFDNEPKFNIDWQKDAAIDVVAALGFNVIAIDKKTKKEKRSISRDTLKTQKGVDDKFLKLFLEYQKHYKVTTSFGQGHLDAINPATGRIHTVYRAIGTATGRMASGSTANNDSITAVTHRPSSYPNMQQLPKDEETRGSFVSEKGNLFCSCDYSAMEARIGAEVYDEKMLLDEFLYRSGDTHAAYAKVVYAEELKDVEIKDIKKVRPDLRNAVKAVEFAVSH
jgi:DNA polymerase I-like protein with 3'-5' exonuclease and polymerase domains